MAVIRCPSCGKPNPDFLDVCQYCDGPLHGPATPPAAPAAGSPEEDAFANLRHAPAEEEAAAVAVPNAELPDWLTRLGAPEGAGVAQPEEEVASTELVPPGKVTNWLDSLRAEEPAEEAESRDWYWTGTQGRADAAQPSAAASEELPDWLRTVSEPAAPATPAASAPAADSEPDWLRNLGGGAEPTQPEPTPAAPAFAAGDELPEWLRTAGEVPAASTPEQPPVAQVEAAAGEELPDWLRSMGTAPAAAQPEAAAAAPAFAAATDELPDWLQSADQPAGKAAEVPATEGELPDWLHGLGAATAPAQPEPAPAAPAFATSEEELPDWLRAASGAVATPPAAGAAETELPDWLHGLASTAPAPAEPAPAASAFATAAEEMPDWLRSMTQPPSAEPTPAPESLAPTKALSPNNQPDWLRDLEPPLPAQPTAAEPAVASGEEQPEWLRGLGVTPSAAAAAGTIPVATPASGEEQPEWLRALGIPAAAMPEPAGTPSSAVSPFIGAATALPFAGPAQTAGATETVRMPPRPPVAAAPGPSAAAPVGAGLTKVALPSWLEAMRPVEIQRPTIAPEVDEYEESVGILAGLRGVLRAESVATQPGTSATQVHKLEVSDAQAKQADGLSQLLAKATEASRAARRGFTLLPLARLAVFAILFVAVALPLAVPDARGMFAPAASWPASGQATFTLLDSLSPARPALVAFDYDPAQAGELDPLAQAIVSHLMRRGVPVVGLSTSPAGAALGEALLNSTFPTYTYGSGYLNLGYLPGGPLGVAQIASPLSAAQLFGTANKAQQPSGLQSAFTADFRNSGASVWDTPILTHTKQLSDFGVIVLVSASPDTVRAWVEQIQPVEAANPKLAVVAAVSAGADPLVRPYYETQQIQGLVSGLIGAAQYEKQSGAAGRYDTAASGIFWDTLGFGLLAVILLLIGGNVYYGAMAFLHRQKR